MFVAWALGRFVFYVVWVYAGDEWHHRGRPRPPPLHSISMRDWFVRGDASAALQEPAVGVRSMSELSQRVSLAAARSASRTAGYNSMLEELEAALMPWAVAEEDGEAPVDGGAGRSPGSGLTSPLLPLSGPSWVNRRSNNSSTRPGSYRPGHGLSIVTDLLNSLPLVSTPQAASQPSNAYRHGFSWHGGPTQYTPLAAPRRSTPGGVTGTHSQPWVPINSSAVGPCCPLNPRMVVMGSLNYMDPKTYKAMVWADLGDDEEDEARLGREIAQGLIARHCCGGGAAPSRAQQQQHHQQQHHQQQHQHQQQQHRSLDGVVGGGVGAATTPDAASGAYKCTCSIH